MNIVPRYSRLAFALVALLSFCLAGHAPANTDSSELRTARLVHLGKLWNTVKYFHPFLAYRDIDWDAALLVAVPKVEAAQSVEDYRRAIEELLESLHDPATHLTTAQNSRATTSAAANPAALHKAQSTLPSEWLPGKILLVRFDQLISSSPIDLVAGTKTVDEALLKAKAAIFDLRTGAAAHRELSSVLGLLQNVTPSKKISSPTERFVAHWGYRGSAEQEFYSSRFVSTMGTMFEPKKSIAARPYVFVVGAGIRIPPIALALQAAGDAFIVSEGKLTDESLVSQMKVELGEGLSATVRAGELEYADGALPFHVDAQVDQSGDPIKVAMALLERGPVKKRAKTSAIKPLPPGVWHPDKTYADTPYPSEPLRILAGYRIWALARWFYPYRHLLKEDWDQLLARFIPKLSSAHDEKEYALTLAEMAKHIADGHTRVSGFKAAAELIGGSPAPVRVRLVEGKFVIAEIYDREAAQGAAIGDLVVAVNGERVENRAAALSKYTTSSIPEILPSLVATRLLSGAEGSAAKVKLVNAHGGEREINLPRKAEFTQKARSELTGEPTKIIGNNIGYLDLQLLKLEQVDSSLEALKATRALIIDLRTYPNSGVFSRLGPRFNIKNATVAAQMYEPLVSAENPDRRTFFEQPMPPTSQWKYEQPVVVLIDERAISRSEHTALWLEAGHDVVFIGSRTCGANGELTHASLPGGGRLTFSGGDVRHADGRQLQRVGLIPNVEVKPTLAGIRAGKDEVLERALQYLNEKVVSTHAARQ